MKAFLTWLLVLDVVSLMSCFAYGTAKDYDLKDGWVVVAGGVVAANLASVFFAYIG